MSNPTKRPPSRLIDAAFALEEELYRMGSVAGEALRLRLDSQRNLERTGEKLAELGAVDERLQPLVNGLLDAVKELVDAQQAQADALAARAEELRQRREVFLQLLARFAELGRASLELNGLVQAFAGTRREEGAAPASDPPSLEVVRRTMTELIESAGVVSQAAEREDFEDIASQANSLRQQLQSGRNKLNLLALRHDRSGVVQ